MNHTDKIKRLEALAALGDEGASERLDRAAQRLGLSPIVVEYDGEWPNACRGTLTVKVGDRTVYSEKYCCTSGGRVWFDENWSEHVESGLLEWDDAGDFPENIQEAVRDVLDDIGVCCGGCV